MIVRSVVVVLAAAMLGGCAMRVRPLSYRTLALDVPAGVSADSVASTVRRSAGDLALIASAGDSAWFAAVARGAALHLSGPSRTPPLRLAILGGKPVGDTTLTLAVQGGRPLTVHDALYQPAKNRHLDLMVVRMDTATPAQGAARALLTYVATDVMQSAPVVLGLLAPSAAVADSVARLIRPVFLDVRECGGGSGAPAAAAPMRVFYGPETLIRCDEGRLLTGAGEPVFARFTIGAKS